jgi:hypothetical protein
MSFPVSGSAKDPITPLPMRKSYDLERVSIQVAEGRQIHVYKNVIEKHLPSNIKTADHQQIAEFMKKQIEDRTIVLEELENQSVRYFSESDKKKTQIHFNKKEQLTQIGLDQNGPLKPLQEGVYVFVLKDEKLYLTKKEKTESGKIQHSSFFSGETVDSAGTMIVDKRGHISAINNHSGHYAPEDPHIKNILKYLKKNLSLTAFSNIFVSTKSFSRSIAIMNIFSRCTAFLVFLFSSSTSWLAKRSTRRLN